MCTWVRTFFIASLLLLFCLEAWRWVTKLRWRRKDCQRFLESGISIRSVFTLNFRCQKILHQKKELTMAVHISENNKSHNNIIRYATGCSWAEEENTPLAWFELKKLNCNLRISPPSFFKHSPYFPHPIATTDTKIMSALFNFSSLLTVLLLMICTCTYLREMRPTIFDPNVEPQVLRVLPEFEPMMPHTPPLNNHCKAAFLHSTLTAFFLVFFLLNTKTYFFSWTPKLCLAIPKFTQANGQPPGPIPHNKRDGFSGFFWKLSRIGERLSPYVSASCLLMGLHVLFFKWWIDWWFGEIVWWIRKRGIIRIVW